MLKNKYWGPSQISNPSLKQDLKNYFFSDATDDEIENLLSTYPNELEVICDRYEFIIKLLNFRNILDSKKKISHVNISPKEIAGRKIIEIVHNESVVLEGFEFNGVQYDIEALCQYLLLSLIDTIMGKSPYKTFKEWLSTEKENKSYSLEEILLFESEYQNIYGLSKNFKKAFSDYLPKTINDRLIKTFVISRLELGSINNKDMNEWGNYTDEQKIKKIADYLYSDIRCKYTHCCSRKFLNTMPIISSKPCNDKILLNKVDPAEDNLIFILQDLIKCLLQQKYIEKKF